MEQYNSAERNAIDALRRQFSAPYLPDNTSGTEHSVRATSFPECPLLSPTELSLLFPKQQRERRKRERNFALRLIAVFLALEMDAVVALCIL